jgi:hypothetical protein
VQFFLSNRLPIAHHHEEEYEDGVAFTPTTTGSAALFAAHEGNQ